MWKLPERRRTQKTFHEPSLTKQSFGPACDISTIVRNFSETGALQQYSREPQYGVAQGDFQEAHYAMAAASSSFESLSPEVRAKYGDIHNLIRAMDDPVRASELASDGIFNAFNIPTPPDIEKHGTDDPVPSQPTTPTPDDTPPGGGEATSEASPSS